MNKYIDAEKLKAKIRKFLIPTVHDRNYDEWEHGRDSGFIQAISIIESLQQGQPIEGKQVVIITETNGDANIHWDCRSLDDVKALLASAQSFIADKQVEELRGMGSGPDYNTTEGRFRKAHEFKQEQPDVDLEKEITEHAENMPHGEFTHDSECREHEEWAMKEFRYFYELGLNARKEE